MKIYNRSSEYEAYYQNLGNSDEKLFNSMKDVYMLALVLGVLNENPNPFQGKGGDGIKETIFNDEDKIAMDYLVLKEFKDINILKNDEETSDEKKAIIEKYANGGMEILMDKLGKDYLDLDNLINVVKEIDNDFNQFKKQDVTDLLGSLIMDV